MSVCQWINVSILTFLPLFFHFIKCLIACPFIYVSVHSSISQFVDQIIVLSSIYCSNHVYSSSCGWIHWIRVCLHVDIYTCFYCKKKFGINIAEYNPIRFKQNGFPFHFNDENVKKKSYLVTLPSCSRTTDIMFRTVLFLLQKKRICLTNLRLTIDGILLASSWFSIKRDFQVAWELSIVQRRINEGLCLFVE